MPAQPAWAAPGHVALIIAAYLLTHLGVRIWIGPALGIDDAEQALFSQQWLLSYRMRAPPLFTWALLATGQVLGISAITIALLRYILLGMLLGFMYLTARRLIRDPGLAALAAFSYSAIYVVGYYSHHDLTHTTAMSAFLAASWYVFVRLCEAPCLRWYIALGLCYGLGILAKWNFAIFAAALPLACLLRPNWRPLVLTWKLIPSALLMAAVALPTTWRALQIGPVEADSVATVLGDRSGSLSLVLAKGSTSLAAALGIFSMPFLAIFLLAFGGIAWRGWKVPAPRSSVREPVPDSSFIATVMLVAIALHWLLVPLVRATHFQERLLQPALLILPIYLFMLVERSRVDTGTLTRPVRSYTLALVGIAVLVFAVRIGRHAAGPDLCSRACREMLPAAAIADGLRRAGFDGHGTVVVGDVHLAGNLRVQLPKARVMEVGYPARVWPRAASATAGGQCLAVWTDRNGLGETTRARVYAYLSSQLRVRSDAPQQDGVLAVPYGRGSRRSYRVFYGLYASPQGDCR